MSDAAAAQSEASTCSCTCTSTRTRRRAHALATATCCPGGFLPANHPAPTVAGSLSSLHDPAKPLYVSPPLPSAAAAALAAASPQACAKSSHPRHTRTSRLVERAKSTMHNHVVVFVVVVVVVAQVALVAPSGSLPIRLLRPSPISQPSRLD